MDLSVFTAAEVSELGKAMLRVQAALFPAIKDRDNPFTQSRYATLNSVMESWRLAQLENGIWLAQFPVTSPGGVCGQLALVSKPTHVESGH